MILSLMVRASSTDKAELRLERDHGGRTLTLEGERRPEETGEEETDRARAVDA